MHSKAYRIYKPRTKKIVISRDVVFMEEDHWDWNTDESGHISHMQPSEDDVDDLPVRGRLNRERILCWEEAYGKLLIWSLNGSLEFEWILTAWKVLGNFGQTMKNYLRTRRQKSLEYGEAGCLLRYFEDQQSKNPAYFQTYLMDSEEQITNIFWAVARMRLDYGYFGDVVSLDTTYCTNNAHRPLALFSGFNHHRGVVLFGAALLYDKTAASFKWLFETFLKVHNKKNVKLFLPIKIKQWPKPYKRCCLTHAMDYAHGI
ncbi:protein FAR1-RELATED SEQUENCE 5-like [Senna tora]|uniref:Protein FAR1-RELATED SEQUENCE 5-like n=1 Tax=Senna tora TaxID=362788 RepID=A0A834T9T3_9FABA|nr:protein FAR1-RELATED SEQUENCE 5-like [Senna tora]